jgi:hypothetical protein
VSLDLGAKKVPSVAWEYWGWNEAILFESVLPYLYGLDSCRSECHKRLCKHYGISQEVSRRVIDHLDRYKDIIAMHHALMKLKTNN